MKLAELFNLIFVFGFTLLFLKLLNFIFHNVRLTYRMRSITRNIPGPKSLPILGNALTFVHRPDDLGNIFLEWYKMYGGLFKIWIGNRLYLILAAPQPVERILSSPEFVDKNSDYEALHEWLGTGVATVNGEKWFRRRKMLNKAFLFNRLPNLGRVVNEQSRILLDILGDQFSKKEVFDVSPMLSRCVMDVLAETGMCTRLGSQTVQTHEYFDSSVRVAEILYQKMLRPWLCIPILDQLFLNRKEETECYQVIHSFTDKIITERKQERKYLAENTSNKEKEIANPGFLDILLDAQEKYDSISDKEIQMEISTFMFGGQDTVSTNLAWIFRMLPLHLQVQRKVQAELDIVFGNNFPHEVTLEDISKLRYMDCVIKETLRLYPSGPVFNRVLRNDVKLESGHTLPKGASVQIHAFLLHRDPTSFPNPEVFDPDRFLPLDLKPLNSGESKRHPYSYVPFSAGPRNCIGQKFALVQEKIILAHVLTRFNVEAGPGSEVVEYQWDLVLRPKGGAPIKLTKRKPKE